MDVNLLIADDHKIVLDGLRSLLATLPGMTVVGEASDGRTTVALAKKLSPHLAIIDVNMPDMNGIEATRQIVHQNPKTRVIALSMHSDPHMVSEMLQAGASGYLLKDCAFDELSRAIRMVMTDQIYLSPAITEIVVDDYLQRLGRRHESAFSVLTEREREVLQLLAEGKTTKQIAAILYISVKTVETHKRLMMEKLHIHNIASLTKYAIREGLTYLE